MSVALLLAASLVTALPQAPADTGDVVVRGDTGRRLHAQLQLAATHGLSAAVLVARGDNILLRAGYGPANRATGAQIRGDTPFIIGSLSKQFTATAVLALIADEKLQLSDSLAAIFPDVPADKRAITVHQLLSHTSGLPYLSVPSADYADRSALVSFMLAQTLQPAPGSGYSYSSPGYTILAGIVERVSGQRYEAFVRDRLFKPAGLTRTWFIGERGMLTGADAELHSYTDDNDEGAMTAFPSPSFDFGAGDIVTTVTDLHRWTSAVRAGKVLPLDVADHLFAPATPTQAPNVMSGFGWNVITLANGSTLISHGGDLGGYNAEYRYYPADSLAVVVLSSVRSRGVGQRTAIANEISNLVRSRPGLAIPATASDPVATARLLAGEYRLANGGIVSVRDSSARVMVTIRESEGHSALYAVDSALAPVHGLLHARADTVLAAFLRGEAQEVAARFHPSLSGDIAGALSGMRSSWEGQFGSVRGHQLVGTAVYAPNAGTTRALLEFERGSVPLDLGWGPGGTINGFAPQPTVDVHVTLVPESASSAASIDLITGKVIRVRRSGDRLEITSTGGVITSADKA